MNKNVPFLYYKHDDYMYFFSIKWSSTLGTSKCSIMWKIDIDNNVKYSIIPDAVEFAKKKQNK